MRRLFFIVALCTASACAAQAQGIIIRTDAAPPSCTAYTEGYADVTASTSSGTQDIAITWGGGATGCTPDAVMFFAVNATVAGTAVDSLSQSVGCSDGTSEWTYTNYNVPAADPTDVATYTADDGTVIALASSTSALHAVATFSSFSSDQVTINWTNPTANAIKFYVVAVANADDAACVVIDPSDTDTGTADATPFASNPANWGFLVSGNPTAAFGEAFQTGSEFIVGLFSYDGSTFTQRAFQHGCRDNRATMVCHQVWHNDIVAAYTEEALGGNTQEYTGSAVAGGIRLTSAGNGSNANRIGGLLVDTPSGIETIVGDLSAPSTPGTASVSGLAFECTYTQVVGPSTDLAVGNNETGGDGDGMSLGYALSASQEVVVSLEHQDSAAAENAQSYYNTGISGYVTTRGGTAYQVFNLTSINSDGATWTWTTANSNRRIGYRCTGS